MSAERKRKGQILPIVIVLAILILLIGSGLYYGVRKNSANLASRDGESAPFPGEQAPDFTLPNLNGESVSLRDYRGKVVFLNFFGTWCDPCRSELPDFNRMNKRMEAEGMNATFLLVNVREQPQEVKKFMEENGYTMQTLTDIKGTVAAKYLVQGIPATFIIDENGKIITKRVGAISAALLETLVEQVVH